MSWMIKGAKIITMDDADRTYEKGDIVINEGKIVALGRNLKKSNFAVEKILPGRDKLIIPGLVNAHFHSHDRFDKGRLDNLPLEIHMALYNPPLAKRRWTQRESYLRTVVSAIEMLKNGTTAVIDDVIHAPLTEDNIEAVYKAYEDVGIRALVSIHCQDKPFYKTVPYLDELLPAELKNETPPPISMSIDDLFALFSNFAKRWNNKVKFILSPSGPQRCTDDFLKRIWQLSEKMDLPVISHVLETKTQEITGKIFYRKSIIEHMASLGILTSRTALIHCVWLNSNDIELISKAGSSVIHNPVSNMKLGSGIAPVRKMLDAGIRVGLGTDGNACNDSANILETMKIAALLHKISDFHYDRWIGAKEVLKMATRGGARCACLHDRIGSLSVGKNADMVLFDLQKIPFFPCNNLAHQLVFCDPVDAVDTVIIDGRPVMENGKITCINEQMILDEVLGIAEELKDKIRHVAARGLELEPYFRKAYYKCMEEDTAQKYGQ